MLRLYSPLTSSLIGWTCGVNFSSGKCLGSFTSIIISSPWRCALHLFLINSRELPSPVLYLLIFSCSHLICYCSVICLQSTSGLDCKLRIMILLFFVSISFLSRGDYLWHEDVTLHTDFFFFFFQILEQPSICSLLLVLVSFTIYWMLAKGRYSIV